jgi:integrase
VLACTPETIAAVRAQLDPQNAALVTVLAYEGLRPAEAYALVWSDVLDDRGRPCAPARSASHLRRAK